MALAARDRVTWTRCKWGAAFATVLARALKLDEEEVRATACGALRHEIGKLAIPDEILRKPASDCGGEARHARTLRAWVRDRAQRGVSACL